MKRVVLIAVAALMLASCGTKIIDTVSVEGGQLQGVLTENPEVMIFKGVPYAAAPVGDLRWANPQPVTPWEGVKVADTFGSPSVQRGRQPGSFYYKEFQPEPLPPTSEDCLFLNIWAPSEAVGHPDAKLPVAMWIHGGAYYGGCGNDVAFDGEAWATRGVILVTINYRLGLLGFFSHPELSAENPYGASGNQGIYDQLAAIKWINKNIAQFGGDPSNLTIFGQSAGAGSVKTLVSSPLAKGLVAKAIIQSGGGIGGPAMGASTATDPSAYDLRGKEAMDAAGFDNLAKMRAASSDVISNVMAMSSPHYDGNLVVKGFDQAAYDNDLLDIPYMIGSNGDDMGPEGMKVGCARFGAVRDSLSSKPAYVYFFDRKLPGDEEGAFHSAELWYMFHTLGRSWRPMEEHDYALSDKMMDFWTNFAKYGNPNGKDVDGEWKPYRRSEPYVELLK
ncbi:MAG: carboxylesterase family protein [Bacteroidales bacterium]|nr:carboxylesterase family protein [Bacteroidales bacterium]